MQEAFSILGVKINAVTLSETVECIRRWVQSKARVYIVMTGAHGIIEMQSDAELRRINNEADLVTPDGVPEVIIGRLKGRKRFEKVYAVNTMYAVFSDGVQHGYRHFFYGGKPGVAEKLTKVLEQLYPGIHIVGSYCPPFRPLTQEEVTDVTDKINGSGADIVWCGLGCPKQERWMATFRPLLNASVLLGVGAGFDFLSGEKPLAPQWVVQSGFEWFYRMLSEPKRLVRRYAKVVPLFIGLVILEALGLYRPK